MEKYYRAMVTMERCKETKKIYENSFDVIRLVAAYIVCFSHSFRHFNVHKPEWMLFLHDGSVGVTCFFVMTGFFMMISWEKIKNNPKAYRKFLKKRIMRLYPALWGSFIVICLMDFLLIGEKFSAELFTKYIIKYCIFGNGAGYGENGLGNGVMWTIMVDVLFYLFTPLIHRLMKDKSFLFDSVLVIFFWIISFFDNEIIGCLEKIPVVGASIGLFISLFYEFLIGCLFYFNYDRILAKITTAIALLYGLVFLIYYVIFAYTELFDKTYYMHSPFLAPFVAVLVMFLGYVFGNVKIKVDISYGVFLYHMIAVGTLKWIGITGILGIIITLVIATFMAVLSYYVIDRNVSVIGGRNLSYGKIGN